jgi:hypothetical protein
MSQGRYVSGELVRSVYVVNMSSGGGSGTPGGSDTQIQFNNAGVFGGVANSSVNNATGNITLGNRVSVPLGTAALPSIYPGTDTNTGIYSPGADQLAVATNGTERLRINSLGRVGIGTSSPSATLEVAGSARFFGGSGTDGLLTIGSTGASNDAVIIKYDNANDRLQFYNWGASASNQNTFVIDNANSRVGIGTTSPTTPLEIASSGTANALISAFDATASRAYFQVGGTTSGRYTQIGTDTSTTFINDYFGTGIAFQLSASEKARIDSSGRLLVGTSTTLSTDSIFQIKSSSPANVIEISRRANDSSPARFNFSKTRGDATDIVLNNDTIGEILFRASDGVVDTPAAAGISAQVDGTPGAGDMPGRLVFSTTADGASSTTERMRITSDAYVRLAAGTGGIQFNGDTAAANALDDYEEGTWTPQLEFGGATTGITYNARQGYYVKIGKMVFITVYFNLSSKGTATGNSTVTGLPFTSEDFNISGTTSWPGSKAARRQNHTGADFAMAAQDNTATIGISDGAGSALTRLKTTNLNPLRLEDVPNGSN